LGLKPDHGNHPQLFDLTRGTDTMAGVELKDVIKKYGDVQVIHGIDLQIEDGEFCVFVGPSGCGKSTLLRMVAWLEETTGGTMHIG
jgi:lactose/L-arabinose transport system ATP-binding protein